jgi:hypothetical protein
MPDQSTAAGCEHVLMPIHIIPIGKLDHKAIFGRNRNDRRLVKFAAAPPDVPDNREGSDGGTRQPAGQGIQGVLEQDEKAFTELQLLAHRLSPIPTFSQTAVIRQAKLQTQRVVLIKSNLLVFHLSQINQQAQ